MATDSGRSSNILKIDELTHRITVLAIPLAAEIDEFKQTDVARRIHAWFVAAPLTASKSLSVQHVATYYYLRLILRTWQSFPIGMGTAAVFTCLSNLHRNYKWVHDLAVSSQNAFVSCCQ